MTRDPSTPQALESPADYRRFWWLIGAGWFGTNVAYAFYKYPLRFLLMDLGAKQDKVAGFFLLAEFTNYIKPLAGVLSDAIPFFGTRRRHYLLYGLLGCAVMWLVFGIVPRTYAILFATYTFLHCFIVLISTVLGGVMAEGGDKYRATGRLSAQRVGIFRLALMIGGPVGGWLAGYDFFLTAGLVAAFHFALIPLFQRELKEEPVSAETRHVSQTWEGIKHQGRVLVRSRTLWVAAGLIFLVAVAPGFETPLLFYQKNELHFDKRFIGNLSFLEGGGGVLGAFLFGRLCGRISLRPLLAIGILTHVVAAMLFLGYRTPASAILITGLYHAAQTFALLPLYDLCIRATPKGSEALGYAVMMSVFNLTLRLSDYLGSLITGRAGIPFTGLIYLNAGTTLLVLFAVPFLPGALMDRRDGEACEAIPEAEAIAH